MLVYPTLVGRRGHWPGSEQKGRETEGDSTGRDRTRLKITPQSPI